MLEKFSKPSDAVIRNKSSFFKNNTKHLNFIKSVNDFYIKQPKRTHCKNCISEIDHKEFCSHGVPYSVCKNCSHLNGLFEDTEDFANFLYSDSGGKNYSTNYLSDYDNRVQDIYLPKVEFLRQTMEAEEISDFSVLDVGCGGGHFVKSCEKLDINATGFDPSADLVGLGNTRLTSNSLAVCDMGDFENLIVNTDRTVVGLVGVLEHLREPQRALEAFAASKAKYLYLQVPLFGFSALLEHTNHSVFPRHLAASHTHLYTNQSISWFCDKYGFRRASAWWFGTDMVDLFRHLMVESSPGAQKHLRSYLAPFIDELQMVFDRHRVASGVNMVLAKA